MFLQGFCWSSSQPSEKWLFPDPSLGQDGECWGLVGQMRGQMEWEIDRHTDAASAVIQALSVVKRALSQKENHNCRLVEVVLFWWTIKFLVSGCAAKHEKPEVPICTFTFHRALKELYQM